MGARENKLQEPQISLNEILRMTIYRVFSIPVKFDIYFLGSHKNPFFGVISYNLLNL